MDENVSEPVLIPVTAEGGGLGSPDFLNSLTNAVHGALLAAAEGWAVTQEDGPGEEARPYRYANPAESSVAATVAATAMVEHLQELLSARRARIPIEVVAGVLAAVSYRPGWTFEATALPDGSTGVLVLADLEDVHRPGRVFRTSRLAPLVTSGRTAPVQVVLEGVLRGIMAIEEHETREQLRYQGSRPLDLHSLPTPDSNRIPR